jgi:DNA-binding response OmpR family regulator
MAVNMAFSNELNKQPHILVIDDEIANFEVVEALLHQDNYQLSYAAKFSQGYDQISTSPPDVILLDVMMPEVDGIECCRRIRENHVWQNVPILMVTALSNTKDLAKCMSTGANDLISKPCTGLELRARVRSMVKISQHQQYIHQLEQQLQASQAQIFQLQQSIFLQQGYANDPAQVSHPAHPHLIRRLQAAMQSRTSSSETQLLPHCN